MIKTEREWRKLNRIGNKSMKNLWKNFSSRIIHMQISSPKESFSNDPPGSFCYQLSYMCHIIWLIFWYHVWKWVKLQRLTMRLILPPLSKSVQSTSPIWIYLNIITNGEATLGLNYMQEILEKQNHNFTQNIPRNKFRKSDNSKWPKVS